MEPIKIIKDGKIILLRDKLKVKKLGTGGYVLIPKELIGEEVSVEFDIRGSQCLDLDKVSSPKNK